MADQRRIWDISQPLGPNTPLWPGDTPFEDGARWTHGESSPVQVSWFRTTVHGGTHADAPWHYDPAGKTIDAVDLHPYLGRARLVDLRGCGPVVSADMLRPALHTPVERLLIRTFDAFPHDCWPTGFTAIDAAAITLAAAHGVTLIGTDAPSLDPQDSKTMAAHHAVRVADMRVLEGLVFDAVPAGEYELIALPLPLVGLDAAPVRAILRALG